MRELGRLSENDEDYRPARVNVNPIARKFYQLDVPLLETFVPALPILYS